MGSEITLMGLFLGEALILTSWVMTYAEISPFLHHYDASRGTLGSHIPGRGSRVHTEARKQTQMRPQRRRSIQRLWMETESKNTTEELEQNENYAELILFARILLLSPDCLKRCVSNHTLAQIPVGCVFIFTFTCSPMHVNLRVLCVFSPQGCK